MAAGLTRQASRATAALRRGRSKFAKTSDEEDDYYRQLAEDIARDLGDVLTEDEIETLANELAGYAADSGEAGYAQIGADTADAMFNQINDRAVSWAREYAADLVAQIDETTKDAVRAAVADGFGSGMTADQVAGSIAGITADNGQPIFGDIRAHLIANTELANANSAGALIGYKAARDNGVNVKKKWLVDGDPCPTCILNESVGAIDLDSEFPGGVQAPSQHPDCMCALGPVVID